MGIIRDIIDRIRRRGRGEQEGEEERANPFSTTSYAYANALSTHAALKLSAVFLCENLISDAISVLPVNAFNARAKKNDEQLTRLLRKPNPVYSRSVLLKTLVSHALLRGNGYALIERDDAGRPLSLHILDPSMVEMRVDDLDLPKAAVYQVQGYGPVSASSMLHLRNKSMNGLLGVSTLYFAASTLEGYNATETTSTDASVSGGMTSGIVKVKSPINQTQMDNLKAAWKEAIGSGGSTGGVKTVFMPADVDYMQLRMSPKELGLLENKKYSAIDICRFFMVPAQKAFVPDNPGSVDMDAVQLAFLTDCIQPWLQRLEDEFNDKLGKGHVHIDFDEEYLLRLNPRKAEYYSKLMGMGVVSPNEVASILGFPPYEHEAGSERYMNLANAPLQYYMEIIRDKMDNKIKTPEPGPQDGKES